jgi:hypothetical protein
VKITFTKATHLDLIEARDAGLGWDDWSDARLYYLPILGYVARDEAGKMQGIGVVAWFGDQSKGIALGCFHLTEEFRQSPAARWVHRRAIFVIETMLLMTPKIYATLDPEIPNAEKWLRALGFQPEGDEWVRYRDGVVAGSSAGGWSYRGCRRSVRQLHDEQVPGPGHGAGG